MYPRVLIAAIIAYKTAGTIPLVSESARRRWIAHYDARYTIADGKLMFNGRPVIAMEDIDTELNKLYDNPETMCNGRDRLHQRVMALYAGIPQTRVMEYLKGQEVYQLHKQTPRGKKVTPILTTRPMQIVQIDLVDMSAMGPQNANYNWILTIIDLFSKYLWTYALKNKEAKTVVGSIKIWLEDVPEYPDTIQSDNGSEFVNSEFDNAIAGTAIKHSRSRSYTPQSQGCVEKVNGTLKRLLFAYMTATRSKCWTNALAPCTKNYNTTYHTVIKTTPQELLFAGRGDRRVAARNIRQAAHNTIANNNRLGVNTKFVAGDIVRVALEACDVEVRKAKLSGIGQLAKSYRLQYTRETYIVKKVGRAGMTVASVASDDEIFGVFKPHELQRVDAAKSRPVKAIDGPFRDPAIINAKARQARATAQANAPQAPRPSPVAPLPQDRPVRSRTQRIVR